VGKTIIYGSLGVADGAGVGETGVSVATSVGVTDGVLVAVGVGVPGSTLVMSTDVSLLSTAISCPYCNGAKSNKWQNVNGFIDPCDINYGTHIERHSSGQIISKSIIGDYIFINLSLGLFRHKLLWNIEKLDSQKKQLLSIIENTKKEKNNLVPIYEALVEIITKLDSYMELFFAEI